MACSSGGRSSSRARAVACWPSRCSHVAAAPASSGFAGSSVSASVSTASARASWPVAASACASRDQDRKPVGRLEPERGGVPAGGGGGRGARGGFDERGDRLLVAALGAVLEVARLGRTVGEHCGGALVGGEPPALAGGAVDGAADDRAAEPVAARRRPSAGDSGGDGPRRAPRAPRPLAGPRPRRRRRAKPGRPPPPRRTPTGGPVR